MKKIPPRSGLKLLLARAALAGGIAFAANSVPTEAQAALMVDATVGGAAAGNNYVNFDNLALGSDGGTSNGVNVSFNGNGGVVTGSSGIFYAAPFISGSNGTPFGDSTVSGADTTRYISTGTASATLSFSGLHNYIGLLWGSVDAFNKLEFFAGGTSLGFLTGANIVASANGNQGAAGTYYANITSDLGFDKVVASSGDYAFEFDNVAYDTGTPNGVPEPAALGLLGLGLISLGFSRRRKAVPTV